VLNFGKTSNMQQKQVATAFVLRNAIRNWWLGSGSGVARGWLGAARVARNGSGVAQRTPLWLGGGSGVARARGSEVARKWLGGGSEWLGALRSRSERLEAVCRNFLAFLHDTQ